MAQDEPFGAKKYPKMHLMGEGPGAILSFKTFLSFINRRLVTNIQLKTSRNSFCPFWCLCQKLSLSPLYFNKTLLHKSSEQSSLVSGPGLNSSPLGAKNPGVFGWFNNNVSTANSLVSYVSWGNAFSLSSGDSSLVPCTAGGKLAAPVLSSWPPSVVKGSSRLYLWCSCLFHPAEALLFCSRERTGKDCSDKLDVTSCTEHHIL